MGVSSPKPNGEKAMKVGYIGDLRILHDEAYPFVVVSEFDIKNALPISAHATGEAAVEDCKKKNARIMKAWWAMSPEELTAAESTGEMNPDFQSWVYVWTPETESFTLWKPVETSTMA